MSASVVLFYVYAAVALAGALGLVLAPKLVHAVMSLFATLFSIAALYLLMGNEFLAAMQLFVYGGAVTVLVLFVLMLTRPTAEPSARPSRLVTWVAAGICAVFFGVLAVTLGGAEWSLAAESAHSTQSLATILFSRYVLPFELAGLVLTIALIGSIVLAREDDVVELADDAEPVTAPEPAAGALAEAGDVA